MMIHHTNDASKKEIRCFSSAIFLNNRVHVLHATNTATITFAENESYSLIIEFSLF